MTNISILYQRLKKTLMQTIRYALAAFLSLFVFSSSFAADINVVGSSLSGWNLYYGVIAANSYISFDYQSNNGLLIGKYTSCLSPTAGQYYWSLVDIKSNANWNSNCISDYSKFSKYFSSNNGVTSSATKYSPDFNWDDNTTTCMKRDKSVDASYRFLINSNSSEVDPIFGGKSNDYVLNVIPDGFDYSVRLGSNLYPYQTTTRRPYSGGAEFAGFDRDDYGNVISSLTYTSTGILGTQTKTLVSSGCYGFTPDFDYIGSMPAAEGMTYPIKVTEENPILRFAYAAVQRSGHTSNSSTPNVSIDIYYNEESTTGRGKRTQTTVNKISVKSITPSSSAHTTTVSSIKDGNGNSCGYQTSGWITETVDLTNYKDKTIYVEIKNADCFDDFNWWAADTKYNDHYSYLYFAAKLLEKPKFTAQRCSADEDVVLTLPEYYDSYKLNFYTSANSTSKSQTITITPNSDNQYILSKNYITSYGNYLSITVNGSIESDKQTVTTSSFSAAFDVRNECNKQVVLTDKSSITGGTDNTIAKRVWRIYNYDANLSSSTKPSASNTNYTELELDSVHFNYSDGEFANQATLNDNGQWVCLTIYNSAGCSKTSDYKFIKPNPEALWKEAEAIACEGEPLNIKFLADENYTGVSGDLKFTIESLTGDRSIATNITVTESADPNVTVYSYTVTDAYGCSYGPNDYNVQVIENVDLALAPDDYTVVDGTAKYIVCHGLKKSVRVYTSTDNAKIKLSNSDTYESLTTQSADGNFYSSASELGVGKYTYLAEISKNGYTCQSSIGFSVSETDNAVTLTTPSSVCAIQPVEVTVNNADDVSRIKWWAEDASGNKSLEVNGQETYSIEVPSKSLTYHVLAYDVTGCEFNESFDFSFVDQLTPTLYITKNLGYAINSTTPAGHSSSYHELDKICLEDSISIRASVYSASVKSVMLEWAYVDNLGETPSSWKSENDFSKTVRIDSFKGSDYDATRYLILRTRPFNSAGIELCGSYDTIVISTNQQILTSNFVNGTQVAENSKFSFCDGEQVELSILANLKNGGSTTFSYLWNDYGHSTNPYTSTVDNVTLTYSDAEFIDEDGRYYRYDYTVTDQNTGCVANDTISVYIKPLPKISASVDKAGICTGNDVVVTSVSELTTTATNFDNVNIEKWTFSDPITGSDVEQNENSYSINLTNTGNSILSYPVNIKGVAYNGCEASTSVMVSVTPKPSIKVEIVPYYDNVSNAARLDKVCGYSIYKLLVTDQNERNTSCEDSVWVNVKKTNGLYSWLNWSKNSSNSAAYPYVDSTYNDNLTSALNYNNSSGAMFSWYRAQQNTSSTSKYDTYKVIYTNECGCVDSIDYKVEVVGTPTITVSGERKNKDFLCDGETMKLEVSVSPENPDYKYYWMKNWHNAGDTSVVSQIKKGTAETADIMTLDVDYDEDAQYRYYSFQVYGGECSAANNIYVYNVEKPTFSLFLDPVVACADKSTVINLSASSSSLRPFFYTLKPDGTMPQTNTGVYSTPYNTETYWGDGVYESTVDAADYVNAAGDGGQVCVVAASASFAHDTVARNTTNSRYFCYSQPICKTFKIESKPTISYALTDKSGMSLGKSSFCPGEDFYITVSNSAIDNQSADVITLTNLDDNSQSSSTVTAGSSATFGPFSSLESAGTVNYRISMTSALSDGSDVCSADDVDFSVATMQMPIITIGADGWGDDVDSVSYCYSDRTIDLKVNIQNEDASATYKYVWSENGNTLSYNTKVLSAGLGLQNSSVKNNKYSVYVLNESAGCQSEAKYCMTTAVDTPTISRDVAFGCVGGYARYYVNESAGAQYNDNSRLDFTPAYEYHAYKSDVNGTVGEEITDYNSDVDYPSTNGWYIQTCSLKGTKNADGVNRDTCGSTTVRFFFRLLNDQGYNNYFLFTKTSKQTGCTTRELLRYQYENAPDVDSVYLAIRFNSANNVNENVNRQIDPAVATEVDTAHHIMGNELEASEVLARSCPGDKPIFNVKDATDEYPIHGYNIYNVWKKSTVATTTQITRYSFHNITTGRYHNASTSSSSYWSPTLAQGGGRSSFLDYNPNMSMEKTSDCELLVSTYSAGCTTHIPFKIEMTNTPILSFKADNACAFDSLGNYDATVHFKAYSSADADDPNVVHHYTWWDNTNTSYIYPNVTGDGSTENSPTFDPQVNTYDMYHAKMGSAQSVEYSYYLHDQAEGYCESAPIRVTARLYMNPIFTVEASPTPVCEGQASTVTVRDDYNYARSANYIFYKGKVATGKSVATLNNNVATGRTYTTTYTPSSTNDSVFYTAVINYNAAQNLSIAEGANVTKLLCYTTVGTPVDLFETPVPRVQLAKKNAAGAYAANDIIKTVYLGTDSAGTRSMCPDDDYYYIFSNLNQDTLMGYEYSTTEYTLTDVTDDKVVANYTNLSPATVYAYDNVMNANDHTFRLSAVTSNGCPSEAIDFTVPLTSDPTVSLSDGQVVCAGDVNSSVAIKATATGEAGDSFTYKWYRSNVISDASLLAETTEPEYLFKPNSTDDKRAHTVSYISVAAYNQNMCDATATTSVEIKPIPEFSLDLSESLICPEGMVTLMAQKDFGNEDFYTGDDDLFSYHWNSADGKLIGESSSVVTADTSYNESDNSLNVVASVKVADDTYCSSSKSVTVDVYSLPVTSMKLYNADTNAEIVDGQTICRGTRVYPVFNSQLVLGSLCPELTFYFLNSDTEEQLATFVTTETNPANAGGELSFVVSDDIKYSYYVTTNCSCKNTNTGSISVKVADAPDLYFDEDNSSTFFCLGSSNPVTISARVKSDDVANYSWSWDEPLDSYTTPDVTFVPTTPRNYTVTATHATTGCTASKSWTITSRQAPMLDLTYDENICDGGDVTVKVSNIANEVTVQSYTWTTTPDEISADQTEATFKSLSAGSYSYSVYATSDNGCLSNTVTADVTSMELPTSSVSILNFTTDAQITDADKVCPGTIVYPVFSSNSLPTSVCAYDTFYFWTVGAEDTVKVVSQAGLPANQNKAEYKTVNEYSAYQYFVVNSCGCKSQTGNAKVSVAQLPTIELTAVGSTAFCDGQSTTLTLKAEGIGADDANMTWSWPIVANDKIDNSTAANVSIATPTVSQSTLFSVYGTNGYGCFSSAELQVTSFPVPTFELDADEYACDGKRAKAYVIDPSIVDVKAYEWNGTESDQPEYEVTVSGTAQTVSARIQSTDGCWSDVKNTTIDVVPTPAPTVRLMKDASHDLTGPVCPGGTFYPVFSSTESSQCINSYYIVKEGATDTVFASAEPGHDANAAGSIIYSMSYDEDVTSQKYIYYAKSTCGCVSDEFSFTVNKADVPKVQISSADGKSSLCADYSGSVTLQASPLAESVSVTGWTWNNGETSQNVTLQFDKSLFNHEYMVTATSVDGCTSTATFAYDSIPLPLAVISGDSKVCNGGYANVSAESSTAVVGNIVSYLWSNGELDKDISVYISDPVTLTLKVKDDNGCTSLSSDEWTIDPIQKPVITYTFSGSHDGSSVACLGDNLTVYPSVGNSRATFSWFSDAARTTPLAESGAVVKIADDSKFITVTPDIQEDYYYVSAELDGCTADGIVSVKANSLPDFTISGQQWYCVGSPMSFTAKSNNTDNYKFTWDNGTRTTTDYVASDVYNIDRASSEYATISVMATDSRGCSSTQSKTTIINEIPVVKYESLDSICSGETATLKAENDADITYLWYKVNSSGGYAIVSNDGSYQYTTEALTSSTIYKTVATYTSNNCKSEGYITVNVKPLPDIIIESAYDPNYNKIVVCSGDSVELRVSGGDSYVWDGIESKHIFGALGNIAYVDPIADTDYKVTLKLSGCSAETSLAVKVLPVPDVNLTASAPGACFNSKVTLSATVDGSSTALAGNTYKWDDLLSSDFVREVDVTSNTSYTFIANTGGECSGKATVNIEMYPVPSAEIFADLHNVCSGSDASMTSTVVSGTAPYTYSWTDKDNNVVGVDDHYVAEHLTEDQDFYLTVTDAHNCVSKTSQQSITVQNNPSIYNTTLTGYCLGDKVNILLYGANEYLFDGRDSWTAEPDSSFTPDAVGTYTTKVKGRNPLTGAFDKYCVSETITIDDVISEAPQFDITTTAVNNAVCLGGSADLKVENVVCEHGYKVRWKEFSALDGKTEINTGAIGSDITYHVTVADEVTGCETTKDITITVNSLPVAAISTSSTYACQGSAVTFSGSASGSSLADPGYKYTWSIASGASTDTYNEQSFDLNIDANVTAKLSVEDAFGCASTYPVVAYVYMQTNPVVSLYSNDKFCDYDSARISLYGAREFFIDDVKLAGSDTAFVLPVGSYNYKVYGRNPLSSTGQYCVSAVADVNFSVFEAPVFHLTGTDPVCSGDSHNLEMVVDNESSLDNPDLHYRWSFRPDDDVNTVSATISGSYQFVAQVTDSTSGCYSSIKDTISTYDLPSVEINVTGQGMACVGSELTISAVTSPADDGSFSYTWTKESDPSFSMSQASFSEAVDGEYYYTVAVTDGHGCQSAEARRKVFSSAAPHIQIAAPDVICQGQELSVSLSGANSYERDGAAVPTATTSVTMNEAGSVVLTYVGFNTLSNGDKCYSEPESFTVNVKPRPDVKIEGETSICNGSTLTLTASGADSYEWNVSDNDPDDAVLSLVPQGNAEGQYSYQVVGTTDGCSASASVLVTTQGVPSIHVSYVDVDNQTVSSFCEPVQVYFEAVPENSADLSALTYSWAVDGVDLAGETQSTYTQLIDKTTEITATVSSGSNCSSSQTIRINELDKPVFSLTYAKNSDNGYQTEYPFSGDVDVCAGDGIRFMAKADPTSPGIMSYTWENVTGSEYYMAGDVTASYNVVATATNGCVAQKTANVWRHELPEFTLSREDLKCIGDPISITASNPSLSYEWQGYPTVTTATLNTEAFDAGTFTYSAVGTDEFGCKNSASRDVKVLAAAKFHLIDDETVNSFVCLGTRVSIKAITDDVEITRDNNRDFAYNLTYSFDGTYGNDLSTSDRQPTTKTGTQNADGDDLYYMSYSPSSLYFQEPGTYTVVAVLVDENNCSSSDSMEYVINAVPTVKPYPGEDVDVCNGQPLALRAVGADDYYWTCDETGFQSQIFYTGDEFISNPESDLTYVLHGSNEYYNPKTSENLSCSSSVNVDVHVQQSPNITIEGETLICYAAPVELTAVCSDANADKVTYQWEGGANGTEATLTDKFKAAAGQTMTYMVTATNEYGCQTVESQTVSMRAKPQISAVAVPENVCQGDTLVGTVSGVDIVSFLWSNGTEGDTVRMPNMGTDPVKILVTATDVNNCQVSDSVSFKIQERFTLTDATTEHYVCRGEQLYMIASGASSYVWDNNNTYARSTYLLQPDGEETHTVVGKLGVCYDTLDITVGNLPSPVAIVAGKESICMGELAKAYPDPSISGLAAYDWIASTSFDQVDDTIFSDITVDSRFILRATGSNGCVAYDTLDVSIHNLPIVGMVGDSSMCENTNTLLAAKGAESYVWYYTDVTTGTEATFEGDILDFASDDASHKIKVVGTDANGCSSADSVYTHPTATPDFTVEGETTICQGEAIKLYGVNDDAPCTFTWQDSVTARSYAEIVKESGIKSVKVVAELTRKPGCSSEKNVDITVKPQPVFETTDNGGLCENSHFVLTATGADKYVWSSDKDNVIVAPQTTYERDIVSASPFVVQLSGWLDGCRADSVFTFSVNRALGVTASADFNAVCAGSDVTLTAVSNATKFAWTDDSNTEYTETGNVLTTPINLATTFKVYSFSEYGCKDSTTVFVDVTTSPNLHMYASPNYSNMQSVEDGGVVYVCKGDPIAVSANGATSFSWSYGGNTTTDREFNIDSVDDDIDVTLTGAFGTCSSSQSFTIKVRQLPEPEIVGDLFACRDSAVELEVVGSLVDSCAWSGVTGAYGDKNTKLHFPVLFSPVNAQVTAFSADGCYTTKEFTLTYNLPPYVEVEAEKTDVCVGQSALFSVKNVSDTLTYIWNDGEFTGEVYEDYQAADAGATFVKVRAVTAAGCYAEDSVKVTAHAKPYLSFFAYGDEDYATVNADSSIQICQNTTLYINALGANSYVWKTEAGNDTLTGNNTFFKPSHDQTYTLVGTDNFGCVAERDVIVTVNQIPTLTSSLGDPDVDGYVKTAICAGDEVTLDISGADNGYTWSTGSTDASITVSPNVSRQYTVIGRNSSMSCPAIVEFFVTVNTHPSVAIYDIDGRMARTSACKGDEFKLVADGADFYKWVIESDTIAEGDTLTYTLADTTVITCVAADTNGCTASSSFTVNTPDAPTIYFTPSDLEVCAGSAVTIYGRGSANAWYWTSEQGDTLVQNSKITVTPLSDTTYYLNGSNKYGCLASLEVPVTVIQNPTVTVDGLADDDADGVTDTLKACMYNTITLSVSGDADNYEWNTGTTGTSYTIQSLLMNRTYTVKATGSNGCITTVDIPVKMVKQAMLSIEGVARVCKGNTDTLHVVYNEGDFDRFTWSNSVEGDSAEFVISSDTTVTVVAYNSETMCENSASYTVYAKQLPEAQIEGPASVCRGSKAELYASGANNFVWADGTEGYLFSATVTQDTVFRVYATLDGCEDSTDFAVAIEAAPDVTFSGDTAVCIGDSVHLVADNAYRYEWSNGVHTAEMSSYVTTSTTYTLTGYNEAGCPTSVPVNITILGLPRVYIDGTVALCMEDTASLQGFVISDNTGADDAEYAYEWYVGDTLVGSDSVVNMAINSRSVVFTLVGYDLAGCRSKATYSVAGYVNPTVAFVGQDSVCKGEKASLVGTGAKDYVWVVDGDSTAGTHFSLAPEDSVKVTLVSISAQGCTSDSSFMVVAVPTPELEISGDSIACRGTAAVVRVSGAETYLWSDGSTADTFKVEPKGTSEYQVTGYNSIGCSAVKSFMVELKENPVFNSYAADYSLCPGDTASLVALSLDSRKLTFNWNSADSVYTQTADTAKFVVSETNVFYVHAVDEFNCQSADSMTVYVYDIPTITVKGDTDVCYGDTVYLIADGGDTRFYNWVAGSDTLSLNPEVRFVPVKSGSLVLTGSIANCKATVDLNYNVKELPSVKLSVSDTMVCRGNSIEMSATGADSYVWITGDTDNSLLVTPVKSMVYSVTGTGSNGCKATASQKIIVNELPIAQIKTSKTVVCAGSLDTVHVMVNTNKDIAEYLWTTDVFNDDVIAQANSEELYATFSDTTVLKLQLTDDYGCVSVDSVRILKYMAPALQYNIYPTVISEKSRVVRVSGAVPSDAVWTWNMGDGQGEQTGEVVDYTYRVPEEDEDSFFVHIYAVDERGCEYNADTIVYKWHDFWAPEAFSPNNDGVNDVFRFRGTRFFENFHYVIYNRMGEIIFKGDADDVWDGTYKGQPMPVGVYGWTATYKGGKRKGMITIFRNK